MDGRFAALRRREDLIVAVVQRHFPGLERSSERRYNVPAGQPGDSVTVYFDDARDAWLFHRFSTGQHGDVLDVLQWYDGAVGIAGALEILAHDLPAARPMRRPVAGLTQPPRWLARADRTVARALAHPLRDDAWRAYKPFARETMDRFEFGYGTLPGTSCTHERLVYPVRRGGQVVGLRGRAVACGCPIWLSARRSETSLWGIDLLRPGCEIVCVENPVDAALAMQTNPDCVAVATTAGAAAWRDQWTAALVAAKPRQVLIWYDNDLAGCPNAETWASERQAYVLKNGREPAIPAGRRLWHLLLDAKLPASLHEWPPLTPVHADAGDEMTRWWRAQEAVSETTDRATLSLGRELMRRITG